MKPTFPSLALAAGIGLLSLGAFQVAIAQQAMTEAQVRARLTAQGYTDVHDVDFDEGIWKAKADNPAGKKVKLRIDAHTGKVIGIE